MIADNIEKIDRYVSVHPRFAAAFAFLKKLTANPDLRDGRYPLDPEKPDDLFANVQTYLPKPFSEGVLETHEKYIDLQFVHKGEELVYLPAIPAENLASTKPYEPQKDIAFYCLNGYDDTQLLLAAGSFVILFPGEAHGPSIRTGKTDGKVRKIVLKIKSK